MRTSFYCLLGPWEPSFLPQGPVKEGSLLEGGGGHLSFFRASPRRLPCHTSHWRGQGPAICRLVGLESAQRPQNHPDPALNESWRNSGQRREGTRLRSPSFVGPSIRQARQHYSWNERVSRKSEVSWVPSTEKRGRSIYGCG